LACLLGLGPAGATAWGAGGDSEGGAFDFLLLDANARAAAMGGAYSSLASDANALNYNPAGLGRLKRHEATFMHDRHAADISHQYAAGAIAHGRQGFGAHLSYVDYGTFERRTISRPEGGMGSYRVADWMAGVGYGLTIADTVSFGAAWKYAAEDHDTIRMHSHAFDAGMLVTHPDAPGWAFGLVMQNAGPEASALAVREKLPILLRTGLSVTREHFTLSADLIKKTQDEPKPAAGLEVRLVKGFALRMGYNGRNEADIGITAGLGWTWKGLAVDYAIVPYGGLGVSHRAGMTLMWGQEKTAPRTAEKPIQAAASATAPAKDVQEPVSPAPDDTVEDPGRYLDEAKAFIAAREFASAKAALAKAGALLGPDDRLRVRYLERMGLVALFENKTARAADFYRDALLLASNFGLSDRTVGDAHEGMGICLSAQGDHENALKFLKQAFSIRPSARTSRLIEESQKKLEASLNPGD
jgi:tetratricopeptide (TPR) repeat protein